jgi:hypothetical protein
VVYTEFRYTALIFRTWQKFWLWSPQLVTWIISSLLSWSEHEETVWNCLIYMCQTFGFGWSTCLTTNLSFYLEQNVVSAYFFLVTFFFFLWYWWMNPGQILSLTRQVLYHCYFYFYFWKRVLLTLPGLASNWDLPASTSLLAGIVSMYHHT